MITLTGRAAMMDAVCKAFMPPASNRIAVTKPSLIPQMIRNFCGGFLSPMLSIVVMTKVPESDEVINHMAKSKVAKADMPQVSLEISESRAMLP